MMLSYSVMLFNFRENALVASELLRDLLGCDLLDFRIDVDVDDSSENLVAGHFQVFGENGSLLRSTANRHLV